MKYWDAVLAEVVHKDDVSVPKRFTMVGYINPRKLSGRSPSKKNEERKVKLNNFQSKFSQFLRNEPFSWREIECLSCFVNKFTATQTAEILGLSTRTIEYHTSNICIKFCCHGKKELIEMLGKRQVLCNKLDRFYKEVICSK